MLGERCGHLSKNVVPNNTLPSGPRWDRLSCGFFLWGLQLDTWTCWSVVMIHPECDSSRVRKEGVTVERRGNGIVLENQED